MKLTHVKTGLLIGLVALSVVLSYVLWQGNWQNTGGVSFTQNQNITATSYPQTRDVTAPYKIVFSSNSQAESLQAVGMPDTPLYEEWMKRLANVHITTFSVAPPSEKLPKGTTVTYNFGSQYDLPSMLHLIPNLISPSILPGDVYQITLYLAADKGPVHIRIEGTQNSYVATTTMDANHFANDVATLIKQNPWQPWGPFSMNDVPAQETSVQLFEIGTSEPPILPLVHSFFANPQALTRLQEGKDRVLWTDGSQVVWWDESAQTITYADPNTSRTSTTRESDLDAAMRFVRNHGGSRQNSVLSQTQHSDASTAYTLTTYINGLPILGGDETYQVHIQDGRVVEYHRPLLDFTSRLAETTVKAIGVNELLNILTEELPNESGLNLRQVLDVQFGYYSQANPDSSITLLPAYFIYQGPTLVGIVDAQSGKALKGMSKQ